MGLTRALVAGTALPLALACGGADAADAGDTARDAAAADAAALPTVRAGDLTLSRIVAPAPIADGPMAFYVEIANAGAAADTLLAATVAGASASLHETADGRMRPVARLPVPAGATVALRPGGLHGMVEGAAAPPVPGDTLRVTLRFARAGDVAIAAPVVAYAALEARLGPAGTHAGH